MKYFLDTEFIEGFHKPLFGKRRHFIDLISIGIVAEDGRTYYAISNEFDERKASKWVIDNVISKLEPRYKIIGETFPGFDYEYTSHPITQESPIWKSNKQIAFEVLQFIYDPDAELWNVWSGTSDEYFKILSNSKDPDMSPEFYGYFADYDWVLFCALYGTMMDLPKGYPMFCRDLKQMLVDKEEYLKTYLPHKMRVRIDAEHGAFLNNLSEHPRYPKQANEHNALDDADWNKKLYDFLTSL